MKRVLLIIGGGIAAYRSLDVARGLRRHGVDVIPVMTSAAKEFVTPLSVEVLCGHPVHDDLFVPGKESQIGHIALSRSADLILICPATAHLIARMAHGHADDLATTLLLATRSSVIMAPAMNTAMWEHPATQANIALLKTRQINIIDPDYGEMACGEYGQGRLAPVENIIEHALLSLSSKNLLKGRRFLVTAGPTQEPIDPVRYISNHSSGIQGYAIARALSEMGGDVTLVSGPVSLPPPSNVTLRSVQTAYEMYEECLSHIDVDAALCVAAVSDWRVEAISNKKMKKKDGVLPSLHLIENPDILAAISHHSQRPDLVIGFAAETDNLLDHAVQKLHRKGCDWLLANDVTKHHFGGARNQVHLLKRDGSLDTWEEMDKTTLAIRLSEQIADFFSQR